jgi:hypothetical protein
MASINFNPFDHWFNKPTNPIAPINLLSFHDSFSPKTHTSFAAISLSNPFRRNAKPKTKKPGDLNPDEPGQVPGQPNRAVSGPSRGDCRLDQRARAKGEQHAVLQGGQEAVAEQFGSHNSGWATVKRFCLMNCQLECRSSILKELNPYRRN